MRTRGSRRRRGGDNRGHIVGGVANEGDALPGAADELSDDLEVSRTGSCR